MKYFKKIVALVACATALSGALSAGYESYEGAIFAARTPEALYALKETILMQEGGRTAAFEEAAEIIFHKIVLLCFPREKRGEIAASWASDTRVSASVQRLYQAFLDDQQRQLNQ